MERPPNLEHFNGVAVRRLAMKVREAMSVDVLLVDPEQTIRDAARMMAERDIGALPVE